MELLQRRQALMVLYRLFVPLECPLHLMLGVLNLEHFMTLPARGPGGSQEDFLQQFHR